MDVTRFINKKQREVLAKARETYGDTAQILVSTEELCELAAVCSKYPRYKTKEKAQDELQDKAVDEVADVLIVLDHVINIFGLTPVDIGDRVAGKIARLERWLNTSNSMEQTTVDREVPGQLRIKEMCQGCAYVTNPRTIGPCYGCGPKHSNYKKALPCGSCVHRGDFKNLKPGERCGKCVETDGSLFEPIEEE